MLDEFLTPVSKDLREFASHLDPFSIGFHLNFDTEEVKDSIVIFGVRESRGGFEDYNSELNFDGIRKQLYQLKRGDWHRTIYDLGDLYAGASIDDTYFAFTKIQEELLKNNCTLIILGGTADLAYWQYRSFDHLLHNLNLTCIDNRFRLGNDNLNLSINNYLSKIITLEPHILFEYSHMGYQTYFVAQEELDLMDQLNFDVQRLGKLTESISESEPELRKSDMVVLNLESIQSSDFKSSNELSPNGFSSREICALARYSGINNKVRSFGVYNFKAKNILSDDLLMAEILWYFIEGKNRASASIDFEDQTSYETFYVQIPEQDLIFYHDIMAEQWWLELTQLDEIESKGHQVVPCSKNDYELSLKGKIPDRWWRSYKKLY